MPGELGLPRRSRRGQWRGCVAALCGLSLLAAGCGNRDDAGGRAAAQPGEGQSILRVPVDGAGAAPRSASAGPSTALAQGFDVPRVAGPSPASDALLPPVMHGAD